MYGKTMEYFDQLTQIPRVSKNEEKVRQWLCTWATDNNFTYKIDKKGNLVVYVPGSKGFENRPGLVIQSHMDMVPKKAEGSTHNFATDPIQTYTQDGWLKAKGTTLGADNGIGLAMSMAAAIDAPHPPLELLFTVEEEIGLVGAMELDAALLSQKLLLNLDTEEEGEVCIASAGTVRSDMQKEYTNRPGSLPQYTVTLAGGKGGHSGMDIHHKRANVIILFMNILLDYPGKLELGNMTGGQAMNAIPSDCRATVGVDDIQKFSQYVQEYLSKAKNQYPDDQDIAMTYEENKATQPVVGGDVEGLLKSMVHIPVGVYEMHPTIENFVQTSTNLGTISIQDQIVKVEYMTRGSLNESLDTLVQQIQEHYEAADYDVKTGKKCPGRSQNPNDPFVNLVTDQYENVISKEPKKVAVHAGLECGAISGLYTPPLQAVSIGPDITDAHTEREKVKLQSVSNISQVVEGTLYQLMHG